MPDFLLELRSEEIPARMQAGARADLEKLFLAAMGNHSIAVDSVTVWSTPRRLALIARGLPERTNPIHEDVKGPPVAAPQAAIDGFLKREGVGEDALFVMADAKGRDTYFARIHKPAKQMGEILAEAIPAIVRAFPWPKSMRWSAASLSSESLRWVRPLSGIVALFDGAVVPCQVGDVTAGRETLGHRFHSSGPIHIDGADDYAAKLRAAHVIVDQQERQDLIREKAIAAAHSAGLVMVADEGLVTENAGLTEWPVPLLGRFDEAFLDVPPEVIQLTARTNQKYFICRERTPEGAEEGKLANAFICTANIVASDHGAAIVDGNRKVLAARLSDARFFWEQDRKKTLSEHADGLARITFHEKLGTVADKVERVAKLARWLVEDGIVKPSPLQGRGLGEGASEASAAAAEPLSPTLSPEGEREQLADQAELAARLCKADLVTEMVGEFPELQGLIGGYYAADEGLPQAVAEAIRDHYKPVGQGDDVPTAPVTVAVSLADKLDTLISFLATGMYPTGSKDPFALRRAALALLALDQRNDLNISWGSTVLNVYIVLASSLAKQAYRPEQHQALLNQLRDFEGRTRESLSYEEEVKLASKAMPGATQIVEFLHIIPIFASFMAERLEVQQRAAGTRHDLIDAVFSLAGEVRFGSLLARVHALQAFIGTEDGTNLLAGYKRAANILKKEGFSSPLPLAGGAGGGPVEVGVPRSDTPTPNPSGNFALSYKPEPAEKALMDALDLAGPQAAKAVAEEDFARAMAALATLRAPIDAFFDDVTVNNADPTKREARLGLLARFRDAVHSVADFSKIEG
jgi:glycyl-tRNA synthetase beta chain